MVEEHVPDTAEEDGPAAPFLYRADQPFEPAATALGEAARIAHALEYIAYQLYHVREALGELAAAAEPALGGRGRRARDRGRMASGGEGSGPGIGLSGEVTACDRLPVQGSAVVALVATRAIEVAEDGGELAVRDRLLVRDTGRVRRRIRGGELEVERGGELSGEVAVVGRPELPSGAPGDGTGPAEAASAVPLPPAPP